MIFGIKSVIVWKKNMVMNPSTINFFWKPVSRRGSNFTCLAVILVDFIIKKDENYYPQLFLKECKYIEKEKKGDKYFTDDLGHN